MTVRLQQEPFRLPNWHTAPEKPCRQMQALGRWHVPPFWHAFSQWAGQTTIKHSVNTNKSMRLKILRNPVTFFASLSCVWGWTAAYIWPNTLTTLLAWWIAYSWRCSKVNIGKTNGNGSDAHESDSQVHYSLLGNHTRLVWYKFLQYKGDHTEL